jgi:cytochrome c-type biogenesis protein CcmH
MTNYWLVVPFIIVTVSALFIALYPLKIRRSAFFLIPVLITMILLAYYRWGAWPAWQQYLQQQVVQQQATRLLTTIKTPDELINRLRARLDEHPQSAKGWYLLGRLYSSQGNWDAAKTAFATSTQLNPDDETARINYIQSIWQLNNQQFNPQIRTLLQQLLSKNSNQPDALAMLAMDAFREHHYLQAETYWQKLLKLAPKQSPEAKALQEAIIKAQQLQ